MALLVVNESSDLLTRVQQPATDDTDALEVRLGDGKETLENLFPLGESQTEMDLHCPDLDSEQK